MKFLAIFVLALAAASAFETPAHFKDIPFTGASESRIIGGTAAIDGQFPYQVGLLTGNWCGGSLISSTVILTAAHCVSDIKDGGIAYLGNVRRLEGISRSFGKSAVTIHEQYQPPFNDIALIKIAAVSLSNNIKPVALPARSSSYSNYVGNTATISGWGRISDTSDAVKNLLYAKAVVISNADCAKIYPVDNSMLCISTEEDTATCHGDSGGPAVVNGQQVGISSFVYTEGCAEGYPAGFARVTHFRDWIYNNCGI